MAPTSDSSSAQDDAVAAPVPAPDARPTTAPSVAPTMQPATPPTAPPVLAEALENSDVPLWTIVAAVVAGGLFVVGSLINAAVTVVAPGAYADLGDWLGTPGPMDSLWHATIGDHPRVWVPIVGVGFELVAGLLCLSRRRRRRAIGLAGATAFHAGLLVMGLWEWALPMTLVLAWATVITWRAPTPSAAAD